MLRNTINTVIILTLLIYEIKIEKYTKRFTRAIKNLYCIKQLPADYSCLARTSLWWFQAVPKASGRWQHTPEVGYICPLGREARKSEAGHMSHGSRKAYIESISTLNLKLYWHYWHITWTCIDILLELLLTLLTHYLNLYWHYDPYMTQKETRHGLVWKWATLLSRTQQPEADAKYMSLHVECESTSLPSEYLDSVRDSAKAKTDSKA
jgi:hypothetical protein